eukprot:GILK01013989.1.p1 GENE.GILK01013989.1~~GILK01013989.1.p1  ORF type:complete len:1573 (-),score=378.23 GILK01013989.1:49-4446(-)
MQYLLDKGIVSATANITQENGAWFASISLGITSQTFSTAPEHPDEINAQRHTKALKSVMNWLFAEPTADYDEEDDTVPIHSLGDFDPMLIYDSLLSYQSKALEGATAVESVPDLIPTLRSYQQRALTWMTSRETPKENSIDLHPLWTERYDVNGNLFYYNRYSGQVSLQRFTYPKDVLGGILADEMGLGKTIETLALILSHRAPKEFFDVQVQVANGAAAHEGVGDDMVEAAAEPVRAKQNRVSEGDVGCVCGHDDEKYEGTWVQCEMCNAWQHADCVGFLSEEEEHYVCPHCAVSLPTLLPAKTTLIVSPSAIVHQWKEEVLRHTLPDSVSILVYEGVSGFSGTASTSSPLPKAIRAEQLSRYDIVITTYDVLKSDIYHTEVNTGPQRRYKRRYKPLPCPLTRIHWWRLCLDEAQMVESTTARAAAMALQLSAMNRWCVSGTPIQRGLEDLYGLLLFLQVNPLCIRAWWQRTVIQPLENGDARGTHTLLNSLHRVMWRSSKKSVWHELNLPEQRDEVTRLRFSAVEAHFYKRQHEAVATVAMAWLRGKKHKRQLVLDNKCASKLLHHLLRLRQACCHPQVGSFGIRSLQKNSTMSMDDLLGKFTTKAKLECEEGARVLLCAINGLSAVAQIEQDYESAAALYREALNLAEQYSDMIKVDKFQRLHTLHNLNLLLEGGHITGRTLRDSQLAEQSAKLKEEITVKADMKVAQVENGWRESATAVDQTVLKRKVLEDAVKRRWWEQAIDLIASEPRRKEDLFDKIREAVVTGTKATERNEGFGGLAWHFREPAGLAFRLNQQLEALDKARTELMNRLKKLCRRPTQSDIERSGNCGRCRPFKSGPVCPHCEAEKSFHSYKTKLFSVKIKRVNEKEVEEKQGEGEEEEDLSLEWFNTTLQTAAEADPTAATQDRRQKKKTVTTWADSETEQILKIINSAARTMDKRQPFIETAGLHLTEFEEMKKEFKASRTLWMAQKDQLSILDEVDMCLTKIRLRFPGELIANDQEANFKLLPHEVEFQKAKLLSDRANGEAQLQRTRGQFVYLQTLAKARRVSKLNQVKADAITSEQQSTSSSPPTNLDVSSSGDTSSSTVSMTPDEEDTDDEVQIVESDLESDDEQTADSMNQVLKRVHRERRRQRRQEEKERMKQEKAKAKEKAKQQQAESIQTRTESGTGPHDNRDCIMQDQAKDKSEDTLDPCPICHDTLGADVVILPCGHTLCYQCSSSLMERSANQKQLKCPTCRVKVSMADVAFVSDTNNTEGDVDVTVNGSWGTKIDALIRILKRLSTNTPAVKSLVFSQWSDVLEIVARAFDKNDISFVRSDKGGNKKFHKAVDQFKHDPSIQVLLLPVQRGGNGLNLTEATHVFLLEPLLNCGLEMQAVNRIHRIGQTAETFVHRLIVADTVEEKILSLNRQRAAETSNNWKIKKQEEKLTVDDLISLFPEATPAAIPAVHPLVATYSTSSSTRG